MNTIYVGIVIVLAIVLAIAGVVILATLAQRAKRQADSLAAIATELQRNNSMLQGISRLLSKQVLAPMHRDRAVLASQWWVKKIQNTYPESTINTFRAALEEYIFRHLQEDKDFSLTTNVGAEGKTSLNTSLAEIAAWAGLPDEAFPSWCYMDGTSMKIIVGNSASGRK